MVDINWNILRPVDIGGAFQQGMEQGRQRRAEAEIDKQLAAMAQNPNAPISNELMRFAPREAFQLQQQRGQQQQAQRERDVKMRAAQGDKAAIAELAGIDWDAWSKIGQRDKDAMKARNDYLGNAALRISQAPEAQRPQLWDAAVEQGIALGYGDLASYRGQYSPQSLEALIANSGQIAKLFELERPNYMAAPQGAGLINVKDPAAVAAWNAETGAQAPQIQDGATATNPQTGEKIVFRNGQWQPMGGSVGNGAGGFPSQLQPTP